MVCIDVFWYTGDALLSSKQSPVPAAARLPYAYCISLLFRIIIYGLSIHHANIMYERTSYE